MGLPCWRWAPRRQKADDGRQEHRWHSVVERDIIRCAHKVSLRNVKLGVQAGGRTCIYKVQTAAVEESGSEDIIIIITTILINTPHSLTHHNTYTTSNHPTTQNHLQNARQHPQHLHPGHRCHRRHWYASNFPPSIYAHNVTNTISQSPTTPATMTLAAP